MYSNFPNNSYVLSIFLLTYKLIYNVVLISVYSKVFQLYVYTHSFLTYSFPLWFITGY